MADNYWEHMVYGHAPLVDAERCDEGAVFEWIRMTFPVSGSKIDWNRVKGAHASLQTDDDAELASTAIDEILRFMRPGGVVDHVGDSLSPYGVRFGPAGAEAILQALLEIPEHHYFVDGDRSWLVVVTMEGYLDVVELPDL